MFEDISMSVGATVAASVLSTYPSYRAEGISRPMSESKYHVSIFVGWTGIHEATEWVGPWGGS
jgi:hypothetical protein